MEGRGWGEKKPTGISGSRSLVKNKFQVLISKCSWECSCRPPVDHIQVHLQRFPLHTVALMVPPGQGCLLSPAHCGNHPGTAGRNTFDIHRWHPSSLQYRRLRPAPSAQQQRELQSQVGLLKPPRSNSPKRDPHCTYNRIKGSKHCSKLKINWSHTDRNIESVLGRNYLRSKWNKVSFWYFVLFTTAWGVTLVNDSNRSTIVPLQNKNGEMKSFE